MSASPQSTAPPARALAAVVLAAGQGTRMKSDLPKVLHPIAGQPMLAYPVAAARALDPARLLVVVGSEADPVRDAFRESVEFVVQPEPIGTGDAVRRARPELESFDGDVLILYGDTPLLRPDTLRRMVAVKAETKADIVLLSAAVDVRGIVIRDGGGRVVRVVESTDATPEQQAIEERNTGVYLLDAQLLWKTLAQVGDHNEQGEVYLTDIVELCARDGMRVEGLRLSDAEEALGVDTRALLSQAEAGLRRRKLNRLMEDGVTIVDPASTYVDWDVEVGRDTVIEPGCVLQGRTRVGRRVRLRPHCVIESSEIGDDVEIGPSAHLRPDCRIGNGSRIGNFVEVKNSVLGEGTKADHLSYIGDADVGARASFGCGSITVNYDWESKHRTTVGSGAYVGCNANLIAPVTIEKDSFVAAGSTVTQDVPGGALAVARQRQRNVEGWVARRHAARAARSKDAAERD